MLNKMLLTSFEMLTITGVGLLVLFFFYSFTKKPLKELLKKIKDKKEEKFAKKTAEEQVKKLENTKEGQLNKYEKIIEKIHQNRTPFYSEENVLTKHPANKEFINQRHSEAQLSDELDFEKINLFDDMNFDDKDFLSGDDKSENDFFGLGVTDEDLGFNNFIESDINGNNESFDFTKQLKRKRMVKRSQTLISEIRNSSDRVKAIILLDVLNQRPFN